MGDAVVRTGVADVGALYALVTSILAGFTQHGVAGERTRRMQRATVNKEQRQKN